MSVLLNPVYPISMHTEHPHEHPRLEIVTKEIQPIGEGHVCVVNPFGLIAMHTERL